MKLQAITVSVNYSDFLVHSLKANRHLFDKWIIVTDTKDETTKALCIAFDVICIQTDVFYKNARFNKYAGINEGLKYVDNDAWIIFLDSDIILQPDMPRVLRELKLDITCLYGIDRLNIIGYERWNEFKRGRGLLIENWLLTSQKLELGSRLVHYYGHEGENGRFEGWRPLGFFQLCHKSAFSIYPQDTDGADHCDLLFARLWPRRKRHFIPELLAIHIESHGTSKAMNWHGRRSKPFLPIEHKNKKIRIKEIIFRKFKRFRETTIIFFIGCHEYVIDIFCKRKPKPYR